MDDFKISLQAEIDKAKSKGQINSDISSLGNQVDKLKIQVALDPNNLKNIASQVQNAINGKINIGDINIDSSSVEQQGTKVGNSIKNAITTQLERIQLNLQIGTFDTKLKELQNGFQKLGLSSEGVEKKIKGVNEAYKALKKASTDDDIISANKTLQTELLKVQNDLKLSKIDAKEYVDTFKSAKLSNKIETWLKNNTAATQDARKEMQMYLSEINDNTNKLSQNRYNEIISAYDRINTEMRMQGNLGKSTLNTLKEGAQKFSEWGLASGAIMKTVQAARDMYQAVYDIDTAMTNLYKVTNETDAKYNSFLRNACSNAKELGRSVSSLIEQSATWAKLGYTIDQSEKLAKISSIYSNVGEVDDDTAVSDIVTVMKAYNIAADDAISIVDKYNKLGNEFATSAKDLGEGMSNAASMLSLGGTNINKALALLTGGAEITQSAGELGNALKIGQMRVQGMKGSLEELGEEVDENVESISKMQTHILNLTKGEVNIFDDNNNFKDYYDILEETSNVLDELSSTERADLLETLFGKNRANQGAAVLQAFQSGQVQKAYEATLNAEGSAQQEQERWMQSLEAKTQQFQAAFQSLSNTVLDSGIPKFFVDLGTTGVSVLDAFIDKFGTLGTLVTPIVTGFLSKKGLGLTNYVTFHSLQAYFYKVA